MVLSRCLTGVVLLTACAGARPALDHASDIAPGTYMFQGSLTEMHHYVSGSRPVERTVTGTVHVDEGAYEIASSHGGCAGTRRISNTLHTTLSCPEIVVALARVAPFDGRLRVRVSEVRERRGSCIEWTSTNGRQQCVRYDTIHDVQTVWRNAANVVVTRWDGGGL